MGELRTPRFDVARRLAVILVVVAAFASDASAQAVDAPQLEVAGGHQVFEVEGGLHVSRSFRARALEEWFLSVASPLNDRISLVGEVAGTSLRDAGRGQTFLIGLRYAWSGRRVTPFVEGLVGGASLRQTFTTIVPSPYGQRNSLLGGWQVGGGIDVRITERIAARLAANSLTLYSDRLPSGSTRRFRFAAGAVLRVPPPSDASAFDAPVVEVAAGYQGFDVSRLPVPRGWFVSVGRPVNERVTVVGEIAAVYFRDVTPMILVDERHWYTYLAGVRYAWPGQRVVPFVQALGGTLVFSLLREEALYEEPPRTLNFGDRYLAYQLSGGVDILITRHLAARFSAKRLTADGEDALQFSTGIVVRLGGSS